MPVPDEWYQKSGIETEEFKQAVRWTQGVGRVIAEFNDAVRYVNKPSYGRIFAQRVSNRDDPSLEVVMLPIEDGISLVRRK